MSILDHRQNTLAPDIWTNEVLIPEIRDYIVLCLIQFLNHHNLHGSDAFVESIYIGSSLATYYYTDTTDFDIKVIVDEDEFTRKNPHIDVVGDICEFLTSSARENYFTTQDVPGTKHQLDYYFYSTQVFYPIHTEKYDSLYDVGEETWLKPPSEGVLEDVDVLGYAYEKAHPYLRAISEDIENAKHTLIDYVLFYDYMKSLDADDLERVYDDFLQTYGDLQDSILELIGDRQEIKILRKQGFAKQELESELERLTGSLNYSDENLIFKIVQRYGVMKILSDIKELFDKYGISNESVIEYADVLGVL